MKTLLEIAVVLSGLAALLNWAKPPAPAATVVVSPTPREEQKAKRFPRLREAPAPDGTEPMVDYPDSLWFKNVGSKLDGSGMCVFTSFEFCCLWAGLDEFKGFRDWCAEHYPGGGYPDKLAKLVKAYCKAKNLSFDVDARLKQYEGSDPAFIERALKNGWLVGVTLYHSPRYGGGTIYHMTCCPHLDPQRGATLDNNFKPYEWAARDEWLSRIKLNGKYWAFAVVCPGPPPCPTN